MDKKKASEIILSIFVAMIFISSYAIFTNAGGGQQTTSTTTTAPQTVYGTGYANATLLGYNTTLSIYSACNYTYANGDFVKIEYSMYRLSDNALVRTTDKAAAEKGGI